jgi:hypothetical protein
MIKKMKESKSASRNKRDRSPASIWLDGEVFVSDPEYIPSDFDLWSDHSDNSIQARYMKFDIGRITQTHANWCSPPTLHVPGRPDLSHRQTSEIATGPGS